MVKHTRSIAQLPPYPVLVTRDASIIEQYKVRYAKFQDAYILQDYLYVQNTHVKRAIASLYETCGDPEQYVFDNGNGDSIHFDVYGNIYINGADTEERVYEESGEYLLSLIASNETYVATRVVDHPFALLDDVLPLKSSFFFVRVLPYGRFDDRYQQVLCGIESKKTLARLESRRFTVGKTAAISDNVSITVRTGTNAHPFTIDYQEQNRVVPYIDIVEECMPRRLDIRILSLPKQDYSLGI